MKTSRKRAEEEALAAAVRLLVLGAVRRRGRAHGYQVREDLQAWGAHEWSTATSGSVYHALKAMSGEGLLLLHDASPSVAGGPPRMEYEVTNKGEDEYFGPASERALQPGAAARPPRGSRRSHRQSTASASHRPVASARTDDGRVARQHHRASAARYESGVLGAGG